ncbi:toprim domain-containing protein [Spiroplasma endosymbiont of Clivina fossor]|uniref:toprim domain-containing protein n=1 Tax=Spiroplasma endosymbiont of Clivina fossor TaxID=3066282 RepID=UPI00313E44A3
MYDLSRYEKGTKCSLHCLCIVSNWQDLWTLENHQVFNGTYHILMQEIDLQKGISPNDLSLDLLLTRVSNKKWQEIIIATSPTINGELTAQYINELLKNYSDVSITRIAHRLPVGATIHYADQFTLKKSLEGRKKLS